jgi:hypothetical protein
MDKAHDRVLEVSSGILRIFFFIPSRLTNSELCECEECHSPTVVHVRFVAISAGGTELRYVRCHTVAEAITEAASLNILKRYVP